MIDLYCERTTAGLWAEPLNTVSNIAFFVAAWAAWRLARRQGCSGFSAMLLIGLVLCTGIGSTLFHMFASAWSEWLDVIPILLFQIAFLTLYLRNVAGMSLFPLLGVLFGFLFSSYIAHYFPLAVNGSVTYLPALLFLAGLGVVHQRAGKQSPWLLLASAGLFLVSLGFRSIDNAVCGVLPTGTHLYWHLLNGAVFYLVMRAYLLNLRGTQAAG